MKKVIWTLDPLSKRWRKEHKLLKLPINATRYISDFINEELDRGNPITPKTIKTAIEAYEGGAR